MCIRDRILGALGIDGGDYLARVQAWGADVSLIHRDAHLHTCLLYTSDAADERSSVDLGGRRIIKKKTEMTPGNPHET